MFGRCFLFLRHLNRGGLIANPDRIEKSVETIPPMNIDRPTLNMLNYK